MADSSANPIDWLLEQWTGGLASAIEAMAGERPQLSWRRIEQQPDGDAAVLWWDQPFEVTPNASAWAGAPEAAWSDLGAIVLRSAGIEPTDAIDSRNTYLEILSQAFSAVAQAIAGRLGREVNCGAGTEVATPEASASLYEISVSIGGTPLASNLFFALDSALPTLLDSRPAPAEAAAPRPESSSIVPAPEPAPLLVPNTLDLLMDVELPVSVSFGRSELALKDVLKLTTGSIVELSRTISEPVEVIVNNCVIARGEVVVVEGNYGVKIHEIVSREKRLRTIR